MFLEDYRKNLAAIDVFQLFKESVNEHRDLLIELNKSQLNDSGVDSKGQKLPAYSDPYKKKRQKAGRQTSHKDLNFSGEFHSKFYALAFKSFVEMGSKSQKAGYLESNWGKEIFGLTDANLVKASDAIINTFNMKLLNAINR